MKLDINTTGKPFRSPRDVEKEKDHCPVGVALRPSLARHHRGSTGPMTMLEETPRPTDRCVRVWFGDHVIAEYTAEAQTAMRYQAAMMRRFASLQVTIGPAAPDVDLS